MNSGPRQFVQVLWSAVLCAVLFFSGFFVLWTPLPLFHLSLKTQKSSWFLALGGAFVLAVLFYVWAVSDLTQAGMGLAYFGYYLLIAIFLSLGVWKKWNLIRLGAITTFAVTTIVFWSGFLGQTFGLVDIHGMMVGAIQEISQLLDKMAANSPAQTDKVEMLTMVSQAKQWLEWMPKLLPSMIFTFTLLVVAINIGFLGVIYRVRKAVKWVWDFRRLEIPSLCIWGVITAGALFFVDVYVLKRGWPKIIALNLFVAVSAIYFIQGLSIMAWFLKRYSLLFRFGIYGLLILFFQMLGMVVFGLGLADTWFDFRKLHKKITNGG
ncbi:MAG: DUF2232 domain-containing protein [Deltaproteobacteria bacterium]|nr:DUF2232 domain-containing protein [Deltaproteobacteria bacterium]